MKILSTRFKNFGSYPDEIQTIDFSEIPTMTQICGVSGNGKSTIAKVLQYALYGKVEGKKMQDLVNWITKKGLYVWINFISTTGKNVIVERGMMPNMFNLWVDGELYDKAGKPQLQQYLEQELLEIPFYVFNNVISLSVNDFKSFLTMSKADKRAIIDRILGLLIINEMYKSVKDKGKQFKQLEEQMNSNCRVHETNIKKTQLELDRATADIETKLESQKIELQKVIDELILNQGHTARNLKQTIDTSKGHKIKIKQAKDVWHERVAAGKKIKEKIELYKQEKCPTCASSFKTDFYEELMHTLEEQLKGIKEQVYNQSIDLEELKKTDSTWDELIQSYQNRGHQLAAELSAAQTKFNSLLRTKSPSTDSVERILADLYESLQEDQKKAAEYSNQVDFYKSLEEIVGDSGIKQQAIRSILPALNSEISILLREMHIDYQLEFDDNFDPHLSFLGEKIGVGSLSLGEMKRIDIVVLVAIVRLMKMKYPNINLLFLDEIFSNLDPENIHNVLKVLILLHKELDLNIFVITHLPIPHEVFNTLYEVKKVNQFSKFTKSEV